MEKESCGNCYFYYKGECHRNSPKADNGANVMQPGVANWPQTSADDWCGDWKEEE